MWELESLNNVFEIENFAYVMAVQGNLISKQANPFM